MPGRTEAGAGDAGEASRLASPGPGLVEAALAVSAMSTSQRGCALSWRQTRAVTWETLRSKESEELEHTDISKDARHNDRAGSSTDFELFRACGAAEGSGVIAGKLLQVAWPVGSSSVPDGCCQWCDWEASATQGLLVTGH